jgi:hypothetical protein
LEDPYYSVVALTEDTAWERMHPRLFGGDTVNVVEDDTDAEHWCQEDDPEGHAEMMDALNTVGYIEFKA